MAKLLLTLSALLISRAAHSEPVVLVTEGRPSATVILPEKPLPSQQLAAEELVTFLKKMSGVELPLCRANNLPEGKTGVRILVGGSALVTELGLRVDELPREGFLMRTVGDALVLAGEDGAAYPKVKDPFHIYVRTGTLFAVYAFLEDVLGVRWLWPGETGEVAPQQTTVRVPPLDRRDGPRFFKRQLRPMFSSNWLKRYREKVRFYDDAVIRQLQRDEALWLKRMRMGRNRIIHYGHAFDRWWERYGKEHPEYFALLEDGRRGPKHAMSPGTVKMCVSQPNFWDRLVRDFTKAHERSPELIQSVNCCGNDGSDGFCTCENCRAWDVPGQKSLSDRYCRFYNAVAERLALVNPDAWVTAYAYSRYRLAPVKTRLRDRVLVGFVGFGYPSTEEARAATRADWLAWSRAGARLFVRPNALIWGHGMPYLYTHALADDFRFCAQNGMLGTDFDSLTGYWATTGPTYYVLAKLHWHPEADVEQLLDGYYSAFGPAAEHVRRYFDFWEEWTHKFTDPKVWERVYELSPTSSMRGRVKVVPELYGEEDFKEGAEILKRAEEAVAESPAAERARVEHLRLGLEQARLTAAALAATLGNVSNWKSTNVEAVLNAARALEKFRLEIVRQNVTNVYYLTYQEAWLGDLTGMRMAELVGDRQAVVRLTTDNWLFEFDPEKKGDEGKWYLPSHNVKSWVRMRVDMPWEKTDVGKAWKEEHGEDYNGLAWYRCGFIVPEKYHGKRLKVFFGAVDEDTKVWINGKHVGDHPYVKPDDWQVPFEFDIGEVVRPGGNTIVVRVEDNAGAGGIYKPVWILRD